MKSSEIKKYSFKIGGMNCKSCAISIEKDIKKVHGVTEVTVDYPNGLLNISGKFDGLTEEEIAKDLSRAIFDSGYTLHSKDEELSVAKDISELKIAAPIALVVIGLFIVLQKIGIAGSVSAGNLGYRTAFVIGIVASLSSCMAVVGGILLSFSATLAKTGEVFYSQVIFHASRLISFFVLGGILGVTGKLLQLSSTTTSVLNLFIGFVMLILGINLLHIFSFAKSFQIVLPTYLSRHVFEFHKFNRTIAPFLLGAGTFFLPCGFTQSMQIYSLSLGSFYAGALTMFFFALGTLPVLALLSFGSFGFKNETKGLFFKVVGIIIIFFAIINILNSLAVIGVIDPVVIF